MITVVTGLQFGDEGKGKVVDYLSKDYDVVVRYQGGANAGHTIYIGDKKFVLHLVPSGIFRRKMCILSSGMVIDVEQLIKEIDELNNYVHDVKKIIKISGKAHILMDFHKKIENVMEREHSIGTTKRGIGVCYMFKYARKGIRFYDILDKNKFFNRIKDAVKFANRILSGYGERCINWMDVAKKYYKICIKIKHMITDTENFLKNSKNVLLEGAQGFMLDIDHGTYPFVTSSNSSFLGSLSSTCLRINNVIGVTKAYMTRVGNGPFLTEINGNIAKKIRERGMEFGATTGRARRIGWLDLVMLKHACEINNVSKIFVTKLDILKGMKKIKVCVSYKVNGKTIKEFDINVYEKAKPVYKVIRGWENEESKELMEYIDIIESYTSFKVGFISYGKEREKVKKL